MLRNVSTEGRTKGTSKLIRKTQCPQCLDRGRDNLAIYDDGHAYCYSCSTYIHMYPFKEDIKGLKEYKNNTKDTFRQMNSLETYQYIAHRGISRESMEYYDVLTKVSPDGQPLEIGFPYGSYTTLRSVAGRTFRTVGDSADVKLFGQDRFNSGSNRAITITEGAFDALSIYEVLGRRYPAVSVRSAATARQDCERAYHYLNSFENIYICFDNDKPGVDAAREVAALFDVNKVYHVKLDKYKDANEALQDSPEALRKIWYGAKKYQPKGIVNDYASIQEILSKADEQASASYPFASLDAMSYGIRPGELILFTALEKVGKTEVLRAIEYHLLKTTQDNIGIIHLEEKEKRSVQGLIGYELGVPAHLPDSGTSASEQFLAYQNLTGGDGRVSFYTHFGSDDPDNVISAIRYMVQVNKCKYVFLDHITMLVTGFEDEDERKRLDYISTRLAMLTRELGFTLFMVSHVNDQGQTRGSRNIAKVADLIIHLDRDLEAPDPNVRNKTSLVCRGNRYAGITGPAGVLVFNPRTFTIAELEATPDASGLMGDTLPIETGYQQAA